MCAYGETVMYHKTKIFLQLQFRAKPCKQNDFHYFSKVYFLLSGQH